MNVHDYIFEGRWHFIENYRPPNSKRVLFTNGDSIVIGSVTEQGETLNWLFDKPDMDSYKPIAWMELPISSMLIKHEKILE
jgi:hypothetical protein